MKEESKSAMKREVEARQHLAIAITKLPEKQIAQLNLPENLNKAILEYKKITSNGALRRQAQYLGRLMRELDSDQVNKIMTQLQHRKL